VPVAAALLPEIWQQLRASLLLALHVVDGHVRVCVAVFLVDLCHVSEALL
jgi:hypothetical protein